MCNHSELSLATSSDWETVCAECGKVIDMARPAKPKGAHVRTTVRQLGRVDDQTWNLIQQAVAASGETFTAWAVEALIRKAKRQAKKK
jgi:hypothetical protein